jgi:carbonic anhydrase
MPEACVSRLHETRAELAHTQRPFAVILGCSDSRVPPELVFGGLGLGQLFVVRNAGNLALDPFTIGSIEYGTSVLGATLVVVLGHQRCGAVNAACDAVLNPKGPMAQGSIGALVRAIVPSVGALRHDDVQQCTDQTIPAHAQRMARHLRNPRASPVLAGLIAQNKLWILPALYTLDDGHISWLPP